MRCVLKISKRIVSAILTIVLCVSGICTDALFAHAAEMDNQIEHIMEKDNEVVDSAATSSITVSSCNDFLTALAQGKSPIIVNGTFSVSNGVNEDNTMLPVQIPENTVIRGGVADENGNEPSIDFRCPLQLAGDNVVIENIEIVFTSSTALGSVAHREIFLAGHSLLLDNVSTYLDGADGTLGGLGGSESELLPTVYAGGFEETSVGAFASLTIQNANEKTVFEAIRMGHDAGNDNKVSYTGQASLQMGEKVSIRDGIYTDLNSSASIGIIGSGEDASSNNVKDVAFYGNSNTTLTAKNAILKTTAINNVGNLILDESAVFEFATGSFTNITVKNGACLNLNGVQDVIATGSFTGGVYDAETSTDTRGILVLNENGSLTVEGTVKGETFLQIEDKNFPGDYLEKTYVSSAGCEDGSLGFVLPDSKNGKYELKHENNSWKVYEKEIDVKAVEAEVVTAPAVVDVSTIERWDTPDGEVPYCEIVWKDAEGNALSVDAIDELGLFYYGAVIPIKTEYWESETADSETEWGIYVELYPTEVNDGKYYFYTDSANLVESGEYTFLLCSEIYQGDLYTVADVKAVKDAGLVLAEFNVVFYNSLLGENPDTYMKDISGNSITVTSIADQIYTGNGIRPIIKVMDGDVELEEGQDYSLTFTDNINVGIAKVTIAGKGKYIGTREITFNIIKAEPTIQFTINEKTQAEAVYGTSICFDVSISPYGKKGELSDNISFYKDEGLLSTKVLDETGRASYIYKEAESVFTVGEHTVKAVFSGNDNLNAVEMEAKLVVIPNPSVSDPNPDPDPTPDPDPVPDPDPTPDPNPDPEKKEGLWFEIVDEEETFCYTGQAIKPVIKVYEGEVELGKKDYKVSYSNNKNAGREAKITVTGKGNYTGKDSVYFEIEKKDIKDGDITAPVEVISVIRTDGTVKDPKVTLKLGKTTLKANTKKEIRDYNIEYQKIPTDGKTGRAIPGEYAIWITGNGTNYKGGRTIVYRVIEDTTLQMGKAKISIAKDSPVKKIAYEAQDILPTFTVKIGSTKLEEGKDYKIIWPTLVVGKNVITFEPLETSQYSLCGTKNFTVTVTGTPIKQKNILVKGIVSEGYDYTGSEIIVGGDKECKPGRCQLEVLEVTAKDADGNVTATKKLTENIDYELSYKNNKKAGTATVTIKGLRGYTGKRTENFKIKKINFKTADPDQLEVAVAKNAIYNKNGAKAVVSVSYNGIPLVEKQDYTLTYKNYKTIGDDTATVIIKGKGSFTNSITETYSVLKAMDSSVIFQATDVIKPTTVSKVKPKLTVVEAATGKKLSAKTDYIKDTKYYSDEACTQEITKQDLVAGKTLWAKITLKGNYGDGATSVMITDFRLCSMLASSFKIEKIDPQPYTSREVKPSLENKVYIIVKENGVKKKVVLEEGTHYMVEYPKGQNIKVGTGKVIIHGLEEYGGSKNVSFKISRKNVKFNLGEMLLELFNL